MVRNGFLMPAVVFALLKFCSVKNRHKTIPGNERDGARDLFLARFKVRILRFENRLVRENLEGVLKAINHAMLEGPTLRS